MSTLFPIFMKLSGEPCLVVGAGLIAEQKLEGLLASGAEVQVIAPNATDSIRQLAADGRISWIERTFEPSDVDGKVLVVAATGNRAVNEEVFRAASSRHVLCNAVDEPEHCNFYYPAVVRRGDLQIAISTAGHSPALAQRLRVELEKLFSPEYGDLLHWLGKVRTMLFRRSMDPQSRKRALHKIASREVADRFIRSRRPLREAPTLASRTWGTNKVLMGKVFLVGAGPGNPELLTVKAVRLLQRADVVLHDALVSDAILELIQPGAQIIDIGKRRGQKLLTQDEINALLVHFSATAETVVRLKGGDPTIFGRVGEEIQALVDAEVEYEIVPGITSALASAAAAGISLTDRRYASSVVFTTAHRRPGAAGIEWDKLVTSGSTLVVYMPGQDYAELASNVIAAGLKRDTLCTIVSSATRPEQQVRWTTVSSLPELVLPAPALIIVGRCASALPEIESAEDGQLVSTRETLAHTRP